MTCTLNFAAGPAPAVVGPALWQAILWETILRETILWGIFPASSAPDPSPREGCAC
jgi:hypothetical protein